MLNYYSRLVVGGGWSDKTTLILISTQVEFVVEVGVELGNYMLATGNSKL